MELVERYLQAVKFWLPKDKQDDIIAELREDMRSEIEEKEAAVGHALDKGELEALLKRRGPPVIVAGRFLPRRHLIGPMWFPIYWLVLRLAMAFYVVPWLVVWLILVLNSPSYRAAHPGLSLFATLSTLWTTLWVQFAIITLVFAVLDRYHSREQYIEQWSTKQLPRLKKDHSRVPRSESAFSLFFQAMFLIWLLTSSAFPWMTFGSAEAVMQLNPALRAYYPAIAALTLAGMAQAAVNLWRPEWNWLPAFTRLVATIGGMVVFNSAMKVYPYITLLDPAANSVRYGQAVYFLNKAMQFGLGGVWLGLAIACVVHSYQCVGHVRRWMARRPDGTPELPGGAAVPRERS
jgi:hypothetical protein